MLTRMLSKIIAKDLSYRSGRLENILADTFSDNTRLLAKVGPNCLFPMMFNIYIYN